VFSELLGDIVNRSISDIVLFSQSSSWRGMRRIYLDAGRDISKQPWRPHQISGAFEWLFEKNQVLRDCGDEDVDCSLEAMASVAHLEPGEVRRRAEVCLKAELNCLPVPCIGLKVTVTGEKDMSEAVKQVIDRLASMTKEGVLSWEKDLEENNPGIASKLVTDKGMRCLGTFMVAPEVEEKEGCQRLSLALSCYERPCKTVGEGAANPRAYRRYILSAAEELIDDAVGQELQLDSAGKLWNLVSRMEQERRKEMPIERFYELLGRVQ